MCYAQIASFCIYTEKMRIFSALHFWEKSSDFNEIRNSENSNWKKKLNLNFHAKNSATNVNEARLARNVELDFSCFFKHRVAPAKNFRDILRLLPQAFVFYQCFKKCDLKMSFTVEKMLSPCNSLYSCSTFTL